jgi:hypothetical protein
MAKKLGTKKKVKEEANGEQNTQASTVQKQDQVQSQEVVVKKPDTPEIPAPEDVVRRKRRFLTCDCG